MINTRTNELDITRNFKRKKREYKSKIKPKNKTVKKFAEINKIREQAKIIVNILSGFGGCENFDLIKVTQGNKK